MLTPPKVLMLTDGDLSIGEFGIATRMVQPERQTRAAARRARRPGGAGRDDDLQGEAAAADRGGVTRRARPRGRDLLADDERAHALEGTRMVLGRSKDSDIQVEDANVSRRHAELRREGGSWWLADLDSTNGTELNGKRVAVEAGRGDDHPRRHRPRLRQAEGRRLKRGSSGVAAVPGRRTVRVVRPRRAGCCERHRATADGSAGPGGAGEGRRNVASTSAPRAQDRLHRPAVPLHLADRPQRERDLRAGPAQGGVIVGPAEAASIGLPSASALLVVSRARARRRRRCLSTRCPSRSAAAARTRSRSKATSSPPPSTLASSRSGTGSGSRTSARRTAPSSTVRA